MPTAQEVAKKNLNKSEYRLFNQSLPGQIKKVPQEKIRKARAQTAALVKKYRKSANKHPDDKNYTRSVNLRLRSLEKTLDRYTKVLNKDRVAKRKAKALRGKRSLTEQPKMLLTRKDDARQGFLLKEKRKMYAKKTVEPRHNASAGRKMSKRIAGYMSARTRKNQVAKDRKTSAEE